MIILQVKAHLTQGRLAFQVNCCRHLQAIRTATDTAIWSHKMLRSAFICAIALYFSYSKHYFEEQLLRFWCALSMLLNFMSVTFLCSNVTDVYALYFVCRLRKVGVPLATTSS